MDVQDIIDVLDLHGFEDVEEADKVSVINDTLQEINTREPWPFLEVMVDLDASADVDADGKVTVPGMTPPEVASVLDIINTDDYGRSISWIRRDEHFKRNATSLDATGTPYKYFFVNNDLYLYPIPDTGNFRLTFLQVQALVDASDTEDALLLPIRHHRLVALGALYKLHSQEDDPENAALFKGQFDEKLILMRQDLFKKQWDRPDSILVVDEEDWVD
jgi:hypothetical protein